MQTLTRGATGSAVVYLQERLASKGFHLAADGDFGAKTEAAVKQFQASEALKPDGVVGGQTWSRLLTESQVTPPGDLLDSQRQWLKDQIPFGTPDLIYLVLDDACGALGLTEQPIGSNWSPALSAWVDGYNDYWGIKDTVRRPWCAMFVSSCIAHALTLPCPPKWGDWKGHPFYSEKAHGGAFLGAAAQIESWAKKSNRWTAAKNGVPCPAGSIFTMARATSGSDAGSAPSAGHTGFIVCENSDGTVTTIEGNVSNKVGSHKRKKTALRGWISWWD
jgi:hypothetical protein